MRRKTAGPHLLSPERTPASAADDVMDMDIDTDSERLNGGHTSTSTQPLVLDVVETYKMRGREKTRAVARILHLAGSSTGDDISGLGSAEDDRRKAVHRKFVMIVSSVALATAACLRLAEVIRSSHVVIIVLLCCLFCNELLRVRYFQWKYATTHHKLRRLMERRRAAGLRRLESETTARRAEWSSPPASSTAAFLRMRSNTSATASPPVVNYRRLSVEAFEHLASFVGIRNNEGNFREAREVESWIVRQLLQSGVRPCADPELFKLLHGTLDSVERGGDRTQKHGGGFHCRSCLAQLYSGTLGVRLDCGHELCKKCTVSLVESALDGNCRIPVFCPAGCNTTLHPTKVRQHLDEDTYERFQRLHDVRSSLQQSAPHSRGLGRDLAALRSRLV